jgi:hypothetical protein
MSRNTSLVLYFSEAPSPSEFLSPMTARSFTTCAQSTCTSSPGPLDSSSTRTTGISVVDCCFSLRIALSSVGIGPVRAVSGVGRRTAMALSASLNCLLTSALPRGTEVPDIQISP